MRRLSVTVVALACFVGCDRRDAVAVDAGPRDPAPRPELSEPPPPRPLPSAPLSPPHQVAVDPPPPPPVLPPPTLDGSTPLPPLSPEASALLQRSLSDLEQEFFTLLEAAHIPPSSKVQITDGYGMFARAIEPGSAAERQRRTYLVQLILGYRNIPTHPPGFDLPLVRLENVLWGLDHPMTPAQRRETYDSMVAGFEQTAHSAADREFWRRYAVVSLIQSLSGNPNHLAEVR